MKNKILYPLLAAALIFANISIAQTSPSIHIKPDKALVDEVVSISLSGLAPNQHATLKANMIDNRGTLWQSSAEFIADKNGLVDVAKQSPVRGSYNGGDPMGLFWSMEMISRGQISDNEIRPPLTPVVMRFEIEIEGKTVASAKLSRLFVAEGVRVTDVFDNGLVARLYELEKGGPRPGLIVLGGSEGGISSAESNAALLASHGYAALAVAYFNLEGLPKNLVEVPLDYLEKAIHWMEKRNTVDRAKLGVIGGSKGGELALLVASHFPELKAAVAYVPSSVVWAGIGGQGSSWTFRGKPLPYVPYGSVPSGISDKPFTIGQLYISGLNNKEAVEKAAIPVEKINGPVLLISGKDDQLWPSPAMADMVMARLKKHKHKYRYEHLSYESAGHAIGCRYWPTTHSMGSGRLTLGGTPAANAKAQADSWPRVLHFLKSAL